MINLYTCIRSAFSRFRDCFLQAFKIVVESCKFSMLLLYILWDNRPIFMISAWNQQLQQQLECTILKPDCHSWWISKIQSWREDILEKRYAIKFCLKLGKMPQKRMECFRLAFRPSSGGDSFGRGQHSSNRVSGISTRTIHQSSTPFLSHTIWPRWAPRQFLSLPIVHSLLPVTLVIP